MCGKGLRLNAPPFADRWRSKEFGHVCSRACYDAAELKYAHLVLGRDKPIAPHATQPAETISAYPYTPDNCPLQPTLSPDGSSYACRGCGITGPAAMLFSKKG